MSAITLSQARSARSIQAFPAFPAMSAIRAIPAIPYPRYSGKHLSPLHHSGYIAHMSQPSPPVVLTIAGFDPSSGAGVTADIKTFAAHGCYGVACLTAITVQTTAGVHGVEPLSAATVRHTLAELASDVPIAAVRIGMLGTCDVLDAVSEFLTLPGLTNVVLDPVIMSSSGKRLLEAAGVERLKTLFPRVTVITPNVDEASALTGMAVTNLDEMKSAAGKLHAMGAENVVITGGHLEKPIDLLSIATAGAVEQTQFASDRVRSTSTHGTGCAFAAAVAANLALGRQLRYSVVLAKAFVTKAIARAYPVGKGTGPVHHLYRMDEQPSPRQDPAVPETKH